MLVIASPPASALIEAAIWDVDIRRRAQARDRCHQAGVAGGRASDRSALAAP
jgi:hypothetical protein